MFYKYKDIEGFVEVRGPNNNRVYVNKEGLVLDANGTKLDKRLDGSGNSIVDIDLGYGTSETLVAKLVILAFKRPVDDVIPAIVPFSTIGDNGNLHPSNLGYRFKDGPIESKRFPGFYHVPMVTRYVINKDGDLLNSITGRPIKWVQDMQLANKWRNTTGGYWCCVLAGDGGSTRVKRHRALAYTFLNYPDNVDKLDVNHIDGVPGNDNLSNLEFCTRSENCRHATDKGLRVQAKQIVIENVVTGEQLRFPSMHRCAEYLGLYSGETVRWRINQGKGKVYDGYRFWIDGVDQGDGSVYGVHLESNVPYKWPTVADASADTAAPTKSIMRATRRSKPKPINGFIFSLVPITDLNVEKCPSVKQVVVSNRNDESVVFKGSMRAACNYLNTTARARITKELNELGRVEFGPYTVTYKL